MGHRANLVLVQGGEYVLYYDHWAANRLEEHLFWGPDAARAFIAERDPVGDDQWLDDVWCEGAVVLNLDTQRMIFFGGEDIELELPLRRAYMPLLRQQWPGWEVSWAHRGIFDIAEAVGVDPLPLRTRPSPDVRRIKNEPSMNEMLVTMVRDGQRFASRAVDDFGALIYGPVCIDPAEFIKDQITLWQDEYPVAGLHVDYDTQLLAWWTTKPSDLLDTVATAWPGWRVNYLGDDVDAHLALAAVDLSLPTRSTEDLQSEILDSLERRLSIVPKNYALDSAQVLANAGHKVEVSAATQEFRSADGMTVDDKKRILDGLRARLPVTDTK